MGISGSSYDGCVRLTENLMLIPADLYANLRDRISAFRKTTRGQYIVSRVPANKLSETEILEINRLCDHTDPNKNIEVKKIIGDTIDSYMGRKTFQVVEFGGGYNLLATNAHHHHVLEIDPNIIKEQSERGISASTFEDMPKGTLHTDYPRIAPAIYCFHFMNPGHVEQINTVISHDGFFIANCMRTHDKAERQTMMEAFTKAGLKLGVVNIDRAATQDKVDKAETSIRNGYGFSYYSSLQKVRDYRNERPLNNEFWVAAKDDTVLGNALKQLRINVAASRPELEVWQARILEAT